jgi:malate dehydrogenase (oxaloacetate-decarboxylating)(NADP+)
MLWLRDYSRSYPSVVKPIMQLDRIKHPEFRSNCHDQYDDDQRGPMFFSDTAINPNPSADDLAKIALMTEKTVRMFGMEPVMAMVSFSNFGSSNTEESANKSA